MVACGCFMYVPYLLVMTMSGVEAKLLVIKVGNSGPVWLPVMIDIRSQSVAFMVSVTVTFYFGLGIKIAE